MKTGSHQVKEKSEDEFYRLARRTRLMWDHLPFYPQHLR